MLMHPLNEFTVTLTILRIAYDHSLLLRIPVVLSARWSSFNAGLSAFPAVVYGKSVSLAVCSTTKNVRLRLPA